MNLRFGVFTDLHADFIHDAVARFSAFTKAAKQEAVDFCVQLGDFCQPSENNQRDKQQILSQMESLPFPFYHTLGNHDMDTWSKEEVLSYLNAPALPYSFDCNGVHVILLDACYIQDSKEFLPFDHGNYKYYSEDCFPVLPPNILSWLAKDLAHAAYPSVIFTHQSLVESRAAIRNTEDFRAVIRRAPKGVPLCVCGHEHVDRLDEKEGTYYLCLNSMTYHWGGRPYTHTTYGAELEAKFPYLSKIFPYRDPLFAIISLSDDGITVQGTATEIVGASPEELNFTREGQVDPVSSSIIDRKLPFHKA